VRRKRSPIVASIILKAIGTFWGMFGKKAISSLVGKVVKGAVMPSLLMYSGKTLVSNASPGAAPALAFAAPLLARYSASLYNNYKFQQDYYTQDPYPFVNEAVMDASNRMSRYLDIIRDLQMHRLSLFWLTEPNLSILHSSIVKFANKYNKSPLTVHPSDYYQLELTLIDMISLDSGMSQKQLDLLVL